MELKDLHKKIDRPYYDLVHLQTHANSSYNDGWTRRVYKEELDNIKREIEFKCPFNANKLLI